MKEFVERFKIPIAIVVGFVLFGLIIIAGSSSPEPERETQQASVSSSVQEGVSQEQEEENTESFSEDGQEQEQEVKDEQQDVAAGADNTRVTYVVDGDTVELESGERVRLIGIDTPERGDVYYAQAKEKLEQLVLNKQVRLEKDISETDRYGRLLRYLYVGDTFVNLEMVQQGYAHAYTYPPDIRHSGQFLAAEQEARNKQVGLWAPEQQEAAQNPTPPPSPSSFSVPSCASSDCDCAHFSSHAHAQWFHDNHNPGDSHRLDADNDGLACESLP